MKRNGAKASPLSLLNSMAALFPKIYDLIDKNTNKHATLRCYEPISTEGSSEPWDTFTVKPLNPPGALSLLLLRSDPMYELGSESLRKQLLIEHLLVLHQRVDNELIGRRYPRKKIQDLLAGQVSAQNPTSSPLLEEVLCELFRLQKIHIDRRAKAITFSPPDLRLWKSDRPVLFAELDNCWNFTPLKQQPLGTWLEQKEEEGWKVSWPTADGKFEDIKATLLQKQKLPEGKHKKDELAVHLGRLQALQTLTELQLKT